MAKILRAEQSLDGRWAVLAVGARRIRVERWLDDDPYPRAEVVPVEEPPWPSDADALLADAERVVRRSLALRAELDEPAAPMNITLNATPAVAAWELATLAPIGPLDRQALLGVDDPAERLRRLSLLTEEACTVLAQRLAGF